VSSLVVVRQEWDEGSRRFEAAREDGPRYERLLALLEVVLDELRRRVGQTYTLSELAGAYANAESWAREALEAREPPSGWPRDLTVVLAAAFDMYQRGAVDYEP
jgi:hypothetical protein